MCVCVPSKKMHYGYSDPKPCDTFQSGLRLRRSRKREETEAAWLGTGVGSTPDRPAQEGALPILGLSPPFQRHGLLFIPPFSFKHSLFSPSQPCNKSPLWLGPYLFANYSKFLFT